MFDILFYTQHKVYRVDAAPFYISPCSEFHIRFDMQEEGPVLLEPVLDGELLLAQVVAQQQQHGEIEGLDVQSVCPPFLW